MLHFFEARFLLTRSVKQLKSELFMRLNDLFCKKNVINHKVMLHNSNTMIS